MSATYLEKAGGGERLALEGTMVAGRSTECDLVLTEGHPSRRHASIEAKDDGVWLTDLGSTNGTFVNGQKVEASVRLKPGDRIRFDVEEFVFVDESATVLNTPEADPQATVLRAPPPSLETSPDTPAEEAEPTPATEPVPQPEAGAAPSPTEKSASSETERTPDQSAEKVVEVESSDAERQRGEWAKQGKTDASGTVMLTPEQINEMLNEDKPSPQPLAEADTPYLIVTAGSLAGTTIKLKAGRETNVWTFGSDEDQDIRFEDPGVSGMHARLVNEGHRWRLSDQMSSNGTLVNGKKASVSFLKAGDRIRLGPVELVFQLPEGTGQVPRAGGANAAEPHRSRWLWIGLVLVVIAAAAAYWLI